MGTSQTTSIGSQWNLKGSCKIEVDFTRNGAWEDLGLLDGTVTFTENRESLDQKPANGVKTEAFEGIASKNVAVGFSIYERKPDNVFKLAGSDGVLTNTTGTPVAGVEKVLTSGTWEHKRAYAFQFPTNVAPTITAIVGSVDGALATAEGTDYELRKMGGNSWGIEILDSVTVTTEAQDITITFTYTPIISTRVTTGGGTTQQVVAMRVTNGTQRTADAAVAAELSIPVGSKYFYITQVTLYKGKQTNGFSTEFVDKDVNDPNVPLPIETLFENDEDREVDDQLYVIDYFNAKTLN